MSSDEDRGLVSWLLLYLQHLEYCLDQNTLLLNKYVLNKQMNVYEGQANQGPVKGSAAPMAAAGTTIPSPNPRQSLSLSLWKGWFSPRQI